MNRKENMNTLVDTAMLGEHAKSLSLDSLQEKINEAARKAEGEKPFCGVEILSPIGTDTLRGDVVEKWDGARLIEASAHAIDDYIVVERVVP